MGGFAEWPKKPATNNILIPNVHSFDRFLKRGRGVMMKRYMYYFIVAAAERGSSQEQRRVKKAFAKKSII